MGNAYEIYALRYATMSPRTPSMNFLAPDPHDSAAQDLDYFVWLIRGGGRDILVDTGFNAEEASARARKLTLNPVDALERFGVKASAIRDIIVTHLHYDHAGNLDRFANARFHLQEREMAYATGRCMCNGLLRHPFSVEHVTQMVRHVYGERVNFYPATARSRPESPCTVLAAIPTACRWSRSRPRAGRWCWRPTPRITTPICSAAARFRSSTMSVTWHRAGRRSSVSPATPTGSFPATIRS